MTSTGTKRNVNYFPPSLHPSPSQAGPAIRTGLQGVGHPAGGRHALAAETVGPGLAGTLFLGRLPVRPGLVARHPPGATGLGLSLQGLNPPLQPGDHRLLLQNGVLQLHYQRLLTGDDLQQDCPGGSGQVEFGVHPSKPKPRWDVHLPGAGNRGGSLAGVFRPLIAGPSGSTVSPRLSGWTARRGNFRPSPLPVPWFPSTGFRWLPLSPSPRWPHRLLRPGCSPAEPALVKTGVHQPQLQLRRPEVLPHRFPTVGRRIVPDDPQRPWMLFLQLRQEGNRGPAIAVALQFHPFHPRFREGRLSPVSRHTAE